MKWKDVYGFEFEGSVDEYVEWKSLDKVFKPEEREVKHKVLSEPDSTNFLTVDTSLKPEKVRLYKSKHKVWTRAEKRIVKDIYERHIPATQWGMLLPERTEMAIRIEAHNMGLSKRKGEQWQKKRTITPKSYEPSRERMRFIGKRCAYYMHEFKWGREKAYGQAVVDWKTNKNRGHIASLGIVHPKDKSRTIIYSLVKWSPETAVTKTIDTFSSWDDAQKKMDEEKIADESIGEKYQYAILKKEV